MEIVNAIMILYENTKSMIRSPDGDILIYYVCNMSVVVLNGDIIGPL